MYNKTRHPCFSIQYSLIVNSISCFLSFDSINRLFNRALNSINLLRNDLGDGLAHIATAWEQSTTLKSICGIAVGAGTADLSNQYLDAADARIIALELRFNRALKSANLDYNSIGDEGAAALSDALKSNSTLEELKLHNNEIGAAGAQSLAGMLQVNRALTSVNLLKNDLGDGAER